MTILWTIVWTTTPAARCTNVDFGNRDEGRGLIARMLGEEWRLLSRDDDLR
jgi:hypothetical protein